MDDNDKDVLYASSVHSFSLVAGNKASNGAYGLVDAVLLVDIKSLFSSNAWTLPTWFEDSRHEVVKKAPQ